MSATGNRLLDALPEDSLRLVADHLERVSLGNKVMVYDVNGPLHHVYFPINSVISLVNIMENGEIVEFATVGNEGMAGIQALLGVETLPSQGFSQVPGESWRMEVGVFKELLGCAPGLHALLLRYVQTLFNQAAQSAACNRLHAMEERCSRWLLMTHDRVRQDTFPLKQEFLAQMLGVHRPTVTVAAGILQQAGLIRYRRGIVTIVDREGLENASCECYQVIRQEVDRQIGGEDSLMSGG